MAPPNPALSIPPSGRHRQPHPRRCLRPGNGQHVIIVAEKEHGRRRAICRQPRTRGPSSTKASRKRLSQFWKGRIGRAGAYDNATPFQDRFYGLNHDPWLVRCELPDLFAGVSDGRAGQGRDHPVAAVLALAAAAVVAGMKGCTAITGWFADVPPAVLAGLYLRQCRTRAAAVEDHNLAGPDRCRRRGARRGGRHRADESRRVRHAGRGQPRCRRGGLPAGADAGEAGWQGGPGPKDADGNQVRLLAALAGPDAAARWSLRRPRSARTRTRCRWPRWYWTRST